VPSHTPIPERLTMRLPEPLKLLSEAIDGFIEHNTLTFAASISYYTALSLAPLLVLVLWLAASVSPGARLELAGEVGALIGTQAMDAVKVIVDSASKQPSLGSVAGVIGVLLLVLAASAVFSQLQTALNVIWGTRPATSDDVRHVFWAWLRRRLLAIGILAAFVFLLIVSMAMSTFVNVALLYHGPLWDVVNVVVVVLVFTLLFAALFRYLPDERLPWLETGVGALVTSVLFAGGKYAIEVYLAHSGIAGAYGPAGSFAVLLVWVYYSATIFLFGAECIRAFAARHGGLSVSKPVAKAGAGTRQKSRTIPPAQLRP